MRKLIISSAVLVASLFMFSCSKDYAANAVGVYTISKVTLNGVDATAQLTKEVVKLEVKKTAELKVSITPINPGGVAKTDDVLSLTIDKDNKLYGTEDGSVLTGSADGVTLSLIQTKGTEKLEITGKK